MFLYFYSDNRLICNNSTFILIKGHLKYRLQMILISFYSNQCLTLLPVLISDSCSVGCIKMKAVATSTLLGHAVGENHGLLESQGVVRCE